MENKKCSICKEVKVLTEFYPVESIKRKSSYICKDCNKILGKEGRINRKTKFGGLYRVWASMRGRCVNFKYEKFKRWGGRGITICQEWKGSFQVFYEWAIENGYKKGLQIDRENNDGNYEPDNCRFVTRTENMRNGTSTKLTVEKVMAIKRLLREGRLFQREIGKMFGVSRENISKINVRETWAEVVVA